MTFTETGFEVKNCDVHSAEKNVTTRPSTPVIAKIARF